MASSENRNLSKIKTILAFMLVIMVLWVCKVTSSFSINFILSLFVFLLFLPFCITLDRIGFPKIITTIIATILMVLIIVAFGYFVFFAANNILSTLPSYSSKVVHLNNLIVSIASKWVELPADFSILDMVKFDQMNNVIISAVRTISTSAITIVKDCVFTIVLSVFLFIERGTIIPKLLEVSKTDNNQKVTMLFDRIYKQVAKYIYIKLIVSVATGLCFFAICKFVGQDFAIIIGVLATVLNFIPSLGSITITATTIALAVLQFAPSWQPILIVAIGTILTQMLIGSVLDPKLEGSSLNLSTFIIFCAMSIFGYIWGLVGTFLAVPILSVTVIILANIDETKGLAVLLSSGKTISLKNGSKDDGKDNSKPVAKYDDVVF